MKGIITVNLKLATALVTREAHNASTLADRSNCLGLAILLAVDTYLLHISEPVIAVARFLH